jgi:hypothetical protein
MQEFVSVKALLQYSPPANPRDLVVDRPKSVCESEPSTLGALADDLIERCCGSHSLALVYRFLRNAGMDELEARAEFEQFLLGTLSEKLLDTAARCIGANSPMLNAACTGERGKKLLLEGEHD